MWISNKLSIPDKVVEKTATAPMAKRQLEVEDKQLAKNESKMRQPSNLDNQEIAETKPIVNKRTVKARKVQASNNDAREQYRAKAEQTIEIARQQAEEDIAMVSKEISDAQTNVYVASQQAQGIKVVYNENGTIYYRNCSLKSKNIIEL